MSLNIPANPAPEGYYSRPAEFTKALDDARALLSQLQTSDEWEDAGEREEVKLFKITDKEDSYAIPITKGVAVIENAKAAQVLAAIQLPGFRKKWDARLDEGHPIKRFSQSSYQLYSVMKSPSYFIWARDICAVQESYPDADGLTVIQVSVEDEENLPDAGSYAKSRTRATVELSGWVIKEVGDNVELSYIVKVHLNGSIPTSVVQMLALETPMCVGKVRDTFYNSGYIPYELTKANSEFDDAKTVSVTQTFEDGDGSEATAGERKFTGTYRGVGADTLRFAYDSKRMYPSGVEVAFEGEGASEVKASVDEAKAIVTVEVAEGAKDKDFVVVITPKE